jgi:Protein of unknown function (DUF1326)
LRLGLSLPVQCAPDPWSLRSVSRVPGQRRIFWEHPIGWDTFRSPLLVAGAIHEGNGVRRTIVDEQATKEQREALSALDSVQHGGPYCEIFAAVCPNLMEAVFAPITLNVDREKRLATIQIAGIGETNIEPIKNPVTGEEHRARISLPDGFEPRGRCLPRLPCPPRINSEIR